MSAKRVFLLLFACSAAPAIWAQPPCTGPFCPLPSRPPEAPATVSSAGPHHGAVVRVTGSTGAGSGTLIHRQATRGLVLTAAHVIENNAKLRVTWRHGHTSPARVLKADGNLDVALLEVTTPEDAVIIPLAEEDQWPPQQETVELIGYGGGNFRHWTAKVNGYAPTAGLGLSQTLSLATQTIGGDSGGAIVFRGKLVGVIWGGPLAGPRGPMLATHGTCCVAIRRWIGALLPGESLAPPIARCPPGSVCPCPPRAPAESAELESLRRRLAQLEAELAAVKAQPAALDASALSDELLERMARDARFRGPAGPRGADGRNGRDADTPSVDIDHVANEVKRRLAGGMRIRVEPVRR